MICGLLILAANDNSDKELYIDGDENVFSNFTGAYQELLARQVASNNTQLEMKTNDQGWYSRISTKIGNKVEGYEDLQQYDCYKYIQLAALAVGLLWPTSGSLGVLAAKNESFILCIVVQQYCNTSYRTDW